MKRIAVIESRFGCLHHEVDRNEPSTGWCAKGGHCSFDTCRHIESIEAHDEKVRAAVIDEMVKKLGDETSIDERVSLRHIQEVAKWLKGACSCVDGYIFDRKTCPGYEKRLPCKRCNPNGKPSAKRLKEGE